ncbi:helix-turn-helix transcriptional regulator [Streptomyces sp. RKAG290]|uniref:helix-turn-helix domain-containing protein n=1 Tax=Streptomyces sp. RKAG290 TaxID=2888348 RepID=UPI0020333C0F|nr:helix-turn-helix transcriptional regulator [Streptomyces sp. RKAG290]MCM2413431.1 helix-turn-helix domain-containing protein [Streptomyces sp. RKAG290]
MATPEAEEFAALLKELKGRSGRSYGVLATKLHVSTSTLHRYCNGDAVPNEYGTVERLARLCGATSDELVELHRRWIVAEAARRRGKSEAGKPESAAAGEAPAAPVVDAVPDAGSSPAPAFEAESRPRPEPESEPEPEAGAGPEGEPGPGSDLEREHGPRPEVPVARWRRASARTRVLLATAAVVALTVPTAVVANHLAGASQDDAGRPPAVAGVEDGKKADAVSGASESAAASPSASRKPSPSASTGSATPSVRPTTSVSHGAGAKPAGGTGRPPTVTISSYNWEEPCGQYYLLDQGADFVPPPPVPQDTRGWARALGGVDGGQMLLELTVQGTSQEAVVLRGLNVRVLNRGAPLKRSAFSMGEGCGSGIQPQSFDVGLDDSRPTLTPVAGKQGDETVPAKDFPFRVSSSDVEVFDLDAHVEGHDVSWYLELDWSSGGRTGTLRIDDGGKPFRTSSIAGRPEYRYNRQTSKWEAAG